MNFQANYPIYLQIAEDIKRRIVIGELKPGDKLPSNAELAIAYQVNPNTVQRAYSELERDGIVYSVKGRGNFITQDASLLQQSRQQALLEEFRQASFSAMQAGISKPRLHEALEELHDPHEMSPQEKGVSL